MEKNLTHFQRSKKRQRYVNRERITKCAQAVDQLVEWLLRIQEVRGSNPVIGEFLFRTFIYCHRY